MSVDPAKLAAAMERNRLARKGGGAAVPQPQHNGTTALSSSFDNMSVGAPVSSTNGQHEPTVSTVYQPKMVSPTMPWLPRIGATELEMGQLVASGSFSVIYQGQWKGMDVAVKKLFDPRISPEQTEEFEREIRILGPLRHPNIVPLLGACLDPPDQCMVFEWYARGSLFELLHKTRPSMGWRLKVQLAIAAAQSLHYLHTWQRVIVHRDFKSHNLLVDQSGTTLRLCDFGLARYEDDTEGVDFTAGTPQYMAPELLKNTKFSDKSDVFAFGMLWYEIVSFEVPFEGLEPITIKAKVVDEKERPPVPLSCPKQMSQVMRDCWADEPSKRPSMSAVLTSLRTLTVPRDQ
jgi:serine/threonine protein kinase